VKPIYHFEGFVLDLARGTLLTASGREVALRRKAFELLKLLVENAGRLLDRETINLAIWPGTTVADDGITQCIGDIRRALDDRAQRILKTVPGRGYILLADVEQPAKPTVKAPAMPSLAILAFTNASGDPEEEFLSDGVADDIITLLSRDRRLFVIARSSSFTYKGEAADERRIGNELGVRYVLDGSVRRVAQRIRITAQLVDTESGKYIWAERYDRVLEDIFAVQDEISRAVAIAIGPAVADAEMHRAMRHPLETLRAWELYQRGMWHLGKSMAAANDVARGLFEQAIDLNPMFAPAYVGLSVALGRAATRFFTMPVEEGLLAAATFARKAVELDPGDADAQAALALQSRVLGDTDNATAFALQACALNSNCANAHFVLGSIYVFTGRMAEGRESLGIFEHLSPRDVHSVPARSIVAISYYFERNYAQCVEAAQRLLGAHPDIALTHKWLAASLGQLGRVSEARAALEKSIAVSPHEFDVYVRGRVPWMLPEDHRHMIDGLRKAGWRE
jgi:adenylate cyclase